jgi:hypothetical protein
MRVQRDPATVDPTRAAAEVLAADGVVYGAQRADVCEQFAYNLLFRWFLDMDVAEPSFDHSTFSRNRARLLEHDVAREFFTRVVAHARRLQLLSDEHFTVDGTLVETWASLKSFRRKDRTFRLPPCRLRVRGYRPCAERLFYFTPSAKRTWHLGFTAA